MLLYRSRGFSWVWGVLVGISLAGAPFDSHAGPDPKKPGVKGADLRGGGTSGGTFRLPIPAKPIESPVSTTVPGSADEAAAPAAGERKSEPEPLIPPTIAAPPAVEVAPEPTSAPAEFVGPQPLPSDNGSAKGVTAAGDTAKPKIDGYDADYVGKHVVIEASQESQALREARERGLPSFGKGDWERYKLPPVAATFLVAMLGVVDIDEVTRHGGELPDTELDQLKKLDQDLAYILNIFGTPLEAEDGKPRKFFMGYSEKIDSLQTYLALTENGVPRTGSLSRDYAALSVLSTNRKPDFQNHFVPVGSTRTTKGPFIDTGVLTEVQTLNTVRANHLTELMSAGFNVGSSKAGNSKVVEAMMASVAAFLTTDHHTLADTLDVVADYQEGRRTLPQFNTPAGSMVRLSAQALRKVDDVSLWETNFLRFVQTIRQASYPQYRSTIKAFQRTLNQMVLTLRRLGEQVTKDPQFVELKRTVPELYTLLEGLFTLYPELLPQSIMKEIIFDVVNGAGTKSDKDLLDILIQQTGPIFRNIIQTLSHRKEMGEFQEMFERTQSKNRPVPFSVIQAIIKADPNNYKFDSIDPNPCGVGKIFQCHVGYMNGKKVAIRVRKPGIEKLAAEEYELLMKAAAELGRLIFSGEPDDRIRLMRMQRLIHAEYQAVLAEMNIPATVQNQRTALELFSGRRKSALTGNTYELRVPEPMEAVEGSTIMVMDFIDEMTSLKDFARKDPQVATDVVNLISGEYYENLFFNLFVKIKDPSSKKRVGFGTSDPHGGNFGVQPSFHDPKDGLVTPVNLLDWGAVINLEESQVRDLFILEFGATLKLEHMIADKLWKLKKSNSKTYDEILAEVKYSIQDLGIKKWSASDWIMHMQVNGFLDFPGGLTRLHRARLFLIGLYEQMGSNAAALDRVIDELGTKYEAEITAIAREDFPLFSNIGTWWQAFWHNRDRLATDQKIACAAKLVEEAARVSPLDKGGAFGGRARNGRR